MLNFQNLKEPALSTETHEVNKEEERGSYLASTPASAGVDIFPAVFWKMFDLP